MPGVCRLLALKRVRASSESFLSRAIKMAEEFRGLNLLRFWITEYVSFSRWGTLVPGKSQNASDAGIFESPRASRKSIFTTGALSTELREQNLLKALPVGLEPTTSSLKRNGV